MRATRIFVDQELRQGLEFSLPKASAHYIYRVLRLRPRGLLTLFNGQGDEYTAVILMANKQCVKVLINEHRRSEDLSPIYLTLVQGLPQGKKMELILQKAVELGVNQIIPVITDYCNAPDDRERWRKKYRHWQKIVISACEQCGRNKIPALAMPLKFDQGLEMVNPGTKIILHPGAGANFAQLPKPRNNLALAIGPEGGFSDKELGRAYTAGYQLASMGPRILRTETAALAAISICQMLWGDFS